ncbi:hypothetical protein CVV38_01975 [Candidatus Peregrinibacteria bacterium HGW-Peregrinibacteria-1]|jgi:uncharacterized membrane protein|nr:MAG: hypothetical protein CVV38_01975 [Candidatus Peregrinibacteria bacterium HGW-Peregrinibacteria-1]
MSKYSTPKNVFFHLLMMSMMYAMVISFVALWFAYLDVLFPDQLSYYVDRSYTIRWSSAVMLVSFPVFLLMNAAIGKDMKKHSEVKESGVRRWLVYLTLFIAAITMIIDLMRLVFNFYNGDLTLLFALKSLVLLVVMGLVFLYYMRDMVGKIKRNRVYAVGLSIVVLSSLVAGFLIVGSPAHQRKVRFDIQRVNDLSAIQEEVVAYWEMKEVLPESLEVMKNDVTMMGYYYSTVDPVTEVPYEYNVISNLSFELCAEFETEGDAHNVKRYGDRYFYRDVEGGPTWEHGVGRTCFERTIDPDLYPNLEVLKD